MNPSLLGGGAALLIALAWLLGCRRSVPVLRSTDASAVAALNRAQIEQVQLEVAGDHDQAAAPAEARGSRALALPAAADLRGRRQLRATLHGLLAGDAAERLLAMQTAAAWPDRSVLPLLQRGLRDVDPEVVLAAARGMERFRGRSAAAIPTAVAQLRLPRNAALSR